MNTTSVNTDGEAGTIDVPCLLPNCEAEPGKPCRYTAGRLRGRERATPHRGRNVARLVECPACGAQPGAPCSFIIRIDGILPNGARRRVIDPKVTLRIPHFERLEAALTRATTDLAGE